MKHNKLCNEIITITPKENWTAEKIEAEALFAKIQDEALKNGNIVIEKINAGECQFFRIKSNFNKENEN